MDWREEYRRRLASAEDAMKLVKAGDLVMIPIAGPRVLPGALFRHCTENGVAIDLRVAAPLTDPGWYRAGHEETFRLEFELFIGDFARPAMDEGRATYLPNLFSLNFKDIDEKRPEGRTVDVFLVSVTPPDEHGYVSFGAHNWNKRSHTRRARTVVAEVDAGLRPVCGDNIVHVSEIDAFVEIPPVQITRGLVEAWLRRVEDDSAREAYMGIVDELGEDLDRLIVVGPVMTRLPAAQVRRVLGLAQPPEDVRTIAQNDNFYAMNNALSVDLTGQINAESVFGSRMINGTGGQPEFQIGAALSRGGRGITLLPSTALDGAVSRVVAQHEAGSM